MLGGAEIYSNISQYSAGRCSSNISVYCVIVRNMGIYSRGAIYPSISQYIHSGLLFVSILLDKQAFSHSRRHNKGADWRRLAHTPAHQSVRVVWCIANNLSGCSGGAKKKFNPGGRPSVTVDKLPSSPTGKAGTRPLPSSQSGCEGTCPRLSVAAMSAGVRTAFEDRRRGLFSHAWCCCCRCSQSTAPMHKKVVSVLPLSMSSPRSAPMRLARSATR